MKRIHKSSISFDGLSRYILQVAPGSPDDNWNSFADKNSTGKREVQKQLYKDQRGLCAYCEINIEPQILRKDFPGKGTADFRVEHFHPQSDSATRSPNKCSWGLDWHNMLACCLGGDEATVFETSRFCEEEKHRHCDVPKGNNTLDGIILNPLTDVPPFPSLFDERSVAESPDEIILEPNQDRCDSVSSNCYVKAQSTIRELNLNCTPLNRFRHATLRRIDNRIAELMKTGVNYDNALEAVMCEVFDDSSPTWPPFFTTIRAHYGIAAEKRLKEINYQG